MDRNARKRAERLGPAFGRLTKAQQAEILELRGAAAKRRFEELDTARRAKVRQRSYQRRVTARNAREKAREYAHLSRIERSEQHENWAPENPTIAAIFWKEYAKVVAT